MAELAAGAVTSLLGVIRNEALLLRGVEDDVQFIKEEMESMKSFLAHLARWEPPGGEHDEQVRTWMNQVRQLAHDCNNCIDLYVYRGNPDIHRARGGLRRYLWWVSWFLHKWVAKRQAAEQLRQLKDRARDVGERRMRYDVAVPKNSQAAAPIGGYADGDDDEEDDDEGDDHEDDGDDQRKVATTRTGQFGLRRRRAFIEPRTLDDYVEAKLEENFLSAVNTFAPGPRAAEAMSMVIVAPNEYCQQVLTLARKTLLLGPNNRLRYHGVMVGYNRVVQVDIPAVHHHWVPLQAKEVLYYILREFEHSQSQSESQEQGTSHCEGAEENLDSLNDFGRKLGIYLETKFVLDKLKATIDEMKIDEKLDKIITSVDAEAPSQKDDELLQLNLEQTKDMDQLDIDVIFKLLYKLPEWDDSSVMKIAKKLKEHMEAEEKDKEFKETMGEGGGGEQTTTRMEQVEGGGRGTTKHIKEEEKEEETANHIGEGEGGTTNYTTDEGGEEEEEEISKHIGEGEGGTTNYTTEEEGEEEISKHMEEEGEEETTKHWLEGEEDETIVDDSEEEVTKQQRSPIRLHTIQYAHILRRVFPKTSSSKALQGQQQDILSTKAPMTTLGEHQIKQMIYDAKQEILRELHVGNKYGKCQGTDEPGVVSQKPKVVSQEMEPNFFKKKGMKQKMEKMKDELREQLEIKGLVDKMKHYLKGKCPLIILKIDQMMDVSIWEDIRYALGLLNCGADLLIVTTITKDNHLAEKYCYPPGEPIYYSLAGLYYDTVLKLTSQLKNEDNYNPQIFREILEECEPYESCMKIFTHALYANPKRSNEELRKLHTNLQALPKLDNLISKKMFMFSYNDLPKEYKSCLLYLAIFPVGHNVRRSTLIARWVTEGLTLKEDWLSSVSHANRCFDALIYRCLVYPADIGATGKVQSCVVDKLLHGFITTIARKQHIVDTRLSHHLARHFSIFNDLQLRSSDRIDEFFRRLSESSRVSLLKVLDLEGSKCIGGKIQSYLKVICSKMLLLKYLSLRGTDITQLPSEINNLRDLEVLDIRQTKVCAHATANLLLLKLKRLLAGYIGLNPSISDTVVSVQIPRGINKMADMEVLSNVKAQSSKDLKDIGMLLRLRKLGVVIDDKYRHLKTLLQSISDLHECIRSLSITLPTNYQGIPSNKTSYHLKHSPKHLESLSIRGSTQTGPLLPLFTKDGNKKLVKVTLSSTLLDQDGLNVLTTLPKLQCVRLRHIEFPESTVTFRKDEFGYLKYLMVEGSNLIKIIFKNGAARRLEKMVLSFTRIESISGAAGLPKLEDLELNNNTCSELFSSFKNAKKISKLTLRGILLKQGDIDILAKKPNVRCLELLHKSCDASPNQITFKKDDFAKLHHLIVDCSSIKEIIFASGSAPKLEKIKWSSSTSLSNIHNLPRLKELEFNGHHVPKEVKQAIKKHNNEPNFVHSKPETKDQAKGDEQEDDGAARFSFFCK